MTLDEIRQCLPHRYPFLLVDRILEIVPGERISGLKNVTINEPFFNGHFPEQPVMPGVLIVEALAQVAGVLTVKSQDEQSLAQDSIFFLAGIDNARFRKMVVPGDQLVLESEVLRLRPKLMKHRTRALVDGEIACSADIICVRQ